MEPKTPDPRIKDVTEYFFMLYESVYNRKPQWSGKEAKLLQSLLKSFDSRGLTDLALGLSIDAYFLDDKFAKQNAHPFALFASNPDKYLPKNKAEKVIEKAKELFFAPLDVPLKTFELEGLVKALSETYPPDLEGCKAWMKGQMYMKNNLEMKEGSKTHNNWIRAGQAARQYFGDELVEQCWQLKKSNAEKVKQQAKEILTQEI